MKHEAGASIASEKNVFDLPRIVQGLAAQRQRWRTAQQRSNDPGGRELPSREALTHIMDQLRGVLFPMRLGPHDLRQENEDFYIGHTLGSLLHALLAQVRLELRYRARLQPQQNAWTLEAQSLHIVQAFSLSLPDIRALLDTDVQAAFDGDPAAHSVDEVLLCYPGIRAIIHHRVAHRLHELGAPLIARMVAALAHSQTGIDIHPGARIGAGFFIDHGTGVVIGETAVIGQRVRVYQAVTLGAKRFTSDENGQLHKGLPRHPVVQDDVVIYAGATVLGRVTIGRGATIGGNLWITHDVPPGASLSQARSRNAPDLPATTTVTT